jgi:hypothetical protein
MTDTARIYICLYKSRKLLVTAPSSYLAQKLAAKQFNARKTWDVIVYLADEPIATSSL